MTAPLSPKARALIAAARGALDATEADLDRVRGSLWLAIGAGAAGAASVGIASGEAAAAGAQGAAAGHGVTAGQGVFAAQGGPAGGGVAGQGALAANGGATSLGTAASTAGVAATGTSTLLKAGLVLLVAGAAGGGALSWLRGTDPEPRISTAAPAATPRADDAAEVAPSLAPPRAEPGVAGPPAAPRLEPDASAAAPGRVVGGRGGAPGSAADRADEAGADFEFAPETVRPPARDPDRSGQRRRRAAVADARPRVEAAPGPSLAEELTLVRRARAALRLGMPDRAVELLAQHARRFPRAELAPEAAVVRIEAACALGDGARARALTDAFERAWPASPLRARVHKMCGAAGRSP